MTIVKTKAEIETLRSGGKRLASVLNRVVQRVVPGVSAWELDRYADELIRRAGDRPSFFNYRPAGYKKRYPASLCVSVNDEVVHGLPEKDKILKEGDIVSLDLGLKHRGFHTDMAITVPVGEISEGMKKLLKVTKESLMVGIRAARENGRVGDIGYAIEQFVKPHKFGLIRDLAGHGVGRKVHDDPLVPNFGRRGEGGALKLGMALALEPMLTLGNPEIFLADDGFTYQTKDGKPAAHFEHTILITSKSAEILTAV